MAKTEPRKLGSQLSALADSFRKSNNDLYVLAEELLPVLNERAQTSRSANPRALRSYKLDFKTHKRRVLRTPRALDALYSALLAGRFHEVLLVDAVARFESFLSAVLRGVFLAVPAKLSVSSPGVTGATSISLPDLLASANISDALERVAALHLVGVFHASPEAYFRYVTAVTGFEFSDDLVATYREVKATRDVLIHSAGEVNALYLRRSGSRARGKAGERIGVDPAYFAATLSLMSRAAILIGQQARKRFRGVESVNGRADR